MGTHAKLVAKRVALKQKMDALHEEYDTLKCQTNLAQRAVRAAGQAAAKPKDAANSEVLQKQLREARAELDRFRAARNATKIKLDKVQDQYRKVNNALYPPEELDPNTGDTIRRVNMRLVNGNPDYLYNVFGRDAEITFSAKDRKFDVFFGPKNDRRHAVVDRGGNVSYPDS